MKIKKVRIERLEQKQEIRKKKDNFMDFIQGINKNINMTYVWQKVNFLRNRKTIVDWNYLKNGNRIEER